VFVLSNPSILAQTQNGLFEYSTTWKNLTYYELNKGQLFQNPKKPEQLVFISSAMYISNNAGRGFSFFGPPQYTYIPSGVSSDVDFESGLVYSILYDYNEGKYYPCKIDFNGNYDKITTIPTELKYPSGVLFQKIRHQLFILELSCIGILQIMSSKVVGYTDHLMEEKHGILFLLKMNLYIVCFLTQRTVR